MKLAGGKSYDNGIDFTVKEGNESFVYSARRNALNEVVTCRNMMYERSSANTFVKTLISGIMSILIVLILHFAEKMADPFYTKMGWLLVIAVFWCGMLAFLFVEGKLKKNHRTARYHSVEHKILNFYTQNGYLPRTTDDLAKMPNIYVCCGSTIAVVIALFGTLSIISLMFVPTIVLKILGIAVAALITLLLWATDNCNFAQKWTVRNPTHEEIELGICAMHRLAKEISVL